MGTAEGRLLRRKSDELTAKKWGQLKAGFCAGKVMNSPPKKGWTAEGWLFRRKSDEQAKLELGSGGSDGTVELLTEIFTGGAKKVFCVQLGSGGTKGTATLLDTADVPVAAVNMTAKSEGSRELSYMIRKVLGDESVKEMIILEGTLELERITFPAGAEEEIDTFLEAVKSSKYFTFSKVEGYEDTKGIKEVGQTAFPTGTNPSVTNEHYSNAFT